MSARLLAPRFQSITSPMYRRILIILLALAAAVVQAAPTKSSEPGPKPSPKPKPSVAPSIPVALPNYDEEASVKTPDFSWITATLARGRSMDGWASFSGKHSFITNAPTAWLRPARSIPGCWTKCPETYTTYTIPPEAENFVGATSNKPSEQSKLKRLNYGSAARSSSPSVIIPPRILSRKSIPS